MINIAIEDPVADKIYNTFGKMGPVLNKNVAVSLPMYGIKKCVSPFDKSSVNIVIVIPSKSNLFFYFFYYEDLTCQLTYRLRRTRTKGK